MVSATTDSSRVTQSQIDCSVRDAMTRIIKLPFYQDAPCRFLGRRVSARSLEVRAVIYRGSVSRKWCTTKGALVHTSGRKRRETLQFQADIDRELPFVRRERFAF